jgi:hypothetical protein
MKEAITLLVNEDESERSSQILKETEQKYVLSY